MRTRKLILMAVMMCVAFTPAANAEVINEVMREQIKKEMTKEQREQALKTVIDGGDAAQTFMIYLQAVCYRDAYIQGMKRGLDIVKGKAKGGSQSLDGIDKIGIKCMTDFVEDFLKID